MDDASTGTLTAGVEPPGDWVEAARTAAVVGSLQTWVLSSVLRGTDHDDDGEQHILRGID